MQNGHELYYTERRGLGELRLPTSSSGDHRSGVHTETWRTRGLALWWCARERVVFQAHREGHKGQRKTFRDTWVQGEVVKAGRQGHDFELHPVGEGARWMAFSGRVMGSDLHFIIF